jgi:hypothetical protein
MLTTRSGFSRNRSQLDVARLDRRRERLGVDDRGDRDLVELGALRVVVALEALEDHRLAHGMGGDAERPGADRGEAVLRFAELLERAPAHNGHRAPARALERLGQKRSLRGGEHDPDRVVVLRHHVHDVRDHRRVDRLRGVLRAVVGEEHVLGSERVAVVEGDALAQLEGPLLAVVGDGPVLGEVALGDRFRVDVSEPAQHVRGDLELQDLVDLRRVEGADLADAGPAGAELAARLRGRAPRADPGRQMPRRERAGGREQS